MKVVKGNSMRKVDNFIGVLNRLTGSEEISMIFIRFSYTSISHNIFYSSPSDDISILNQMGFPKTNVLYLYNLEANEFARSLIFLLKLLSLS